MSALIHETTGERQAIIRTRAQLRTEIASGTVDVDAVADRLGLVREGVETLLRRSWSFEEAYRVASALGYDFASALAA